MSSVPRRETLPRTLEDYGRRISDLERLIGQTAASNIGVLPETFSIDDQFNVFGGGETYTVTFDDIPDWADDVSVIAIGTASFTPGAPSASASVVLAINGNDGGTAFGDTSHALTAQHGNTFSVAGLSSFDVEMVLGLGTGSGVGVQFMLTTLSIFTKAGAA